MPGGPGTWLPGSDTAAEPHAMPDTMSAPGIAPDSGDFRRGACSLDGVSWRAVAR